MSTFALPAKKTELTFYPMQYYYVIEITHFLNFYFYFLSSNNLVTGFCLSSKLNDVDLMLPRPMETASAAMNNQSTQLVNSVSIQT